MPRRGLNKGELVCSAEPEQPRDAGIAPWYSPRLVAGNNSVRILPTPSPTDTRTSHWAKACSPRKDRTDHDGRMNVECFDLMHREGHDQM